MKMTLPDVLPFLGLEGITLLSGSHPSRMDGICAMEAVAWLAGEPHSDRPECASPVIAAFMRHWNDSLSDDETRTRLLCPLLPLLLNSRSTPTIELQRSWMAIDWLAREQAPAWLSLGDDLNAHAVALRGLPAITDATSAQAAQPTLAAAGDAAGDAARAAEGDAARTAAWDAVWAAAWDATGAAAGGAARAAAWAATWAAAWAAAGDAAGDAARAAAGDAAWDAAGAATWDAARAAAGDAAWAAARAAAWAAARTAVLAAAWAATGDAAGDAARAAAGAALQPTVTELQTSAANLVGRMAALRADPA